MKKQIPKHQQERTVEVLFGEILKQIRKENGLSQEYLSFESGYHRTYISLLERGKKSPSLKTIFQLAKVLNINPSEFIDRIQKKVHTDRT
ncbi:MAG: helix-turn-helix transcriptional regulator [Deltaproteobacteria bacterium]|nr:helix-turn-helix transcriptional regulator [Deltaproteobacteria bacterium]